MTLNSLLSRRRSLLVSLLGSLLITLFGYICPQWVGGGGFEGLSCLLFWLPGGWMSELLRFIGVLPHQWIQESKLFWFTILPALNILSLTIILLILLRALEWIVLLLKSNLMRRGRATQNPST